MRTLRCAFLLVLLLDTSVSAQQTIYFKKDHIVTPAGAEVATAVPRPADQVAPSRRRISTTVSVGFTKSANTVDMVILLWATFLSAFQLSTPLGSGDEALLRAAEGNDFPGVVRALKQGTNINATTAGGATAVLFAARNGNLDMVKLLVERGADLSLPELFYGRTPVHEAIARGDVAMVEYLFRKNTPWIDQVFAFALEKKQIPLLKEVVRRPHPFLHYFLIAAGHALVVKKGETELAKILAEAMNTRPAADVDLPLRRPLSKLKALTGKYRDDRTAQSIAITLEEDHLVAVLGPRSLMLFALSELDFKTPEMPNAVFYFHPRQGPVTGLLLHGDEGLQLDLRRVP